MVSSKFGYRLGPKNTRDDSSNPDTILPSLEGSLKRLGTDFIDVYLYHCAPEVEWLDAGRAVLEQAKVQGKIRAYGISTANAELLDEMVRHDSVEVVQFPSSLLDQNSNVWKIAQENNLGTQVRGVMAQGRLSGKYFQKTPDFRPDDARSEWCKDDDYTRYAPLAGCVAEGYTMAQTAIRWTLDHPGCHTICMGAKNIDDYRIAITAADLPPLSDDVRQRLEQTARTL